MTVTFTGDTVFKTRLFNVLSKNELGSTSAYSISFADPDSDSGWSFGWTQMDVRNNTRARDLLEDILENATDGSGNHIVDDNNAKTTRPNDTEVKRLVAAAGQNSATALSAADQALIDAALASTYGANAIDAAVDVEFNSLIAIATHVQGLASASNQAFLGTDIARIFVIDYANQYTIDSPGDFERFISGSPASVFKGTVQIDGPLGVDDLLNFYFHLKYPWKNPTDPIRRFGNIAAETGYTPANADEAKNVFRAATFFLHAPNQLSRIRASSGGQATLNTFVTAVLDPARTSLLAALQAQTPALAARLAGLDSLSIYVDPVFAVQDPNNNVVLDSRIFNAQGTELANNDLLIGDGGSDTLTGGLGDDILMGGAGNDHLRGGAGTDAYVYRTGEGTDSIKDAGRDGSIIFDGVTLTGAGAQQWIDPQNRSMPAWRAEISGQVFYFRLHDATVSAGGTIAGNLWIQAEGAAVDQRVVVEGFETRIVNGTVVGDLGLDLPIGPLIMWYVTVNGVVDNPFSLPSPPAPIDPIDLLENSSQTPTIALNAPAAAGQVLRIEASDLADNLQIVTGAQTLSFVDGHVDLTLVEGQTEVTFSLLTRGDISANASVNLTAELLPTGGGGSGPTSTLVVNVIADTGAPLEEPEEAGIVVGTSGDDSLPRTGDVGNVFRGLAGNDTIMAPTLVSAVIEGGTGDDIIHAGSLNAWLLGDEDRDFVFGHHGADHLEGGTGSDYLDGGANRDELFGDQALSIEDAIANGETDLSSLARGDILQGAAGDDTIVGTARVDMLGGHTGQDLLIGGAGNDLIAGDRHFLFAEPSAGALDSWGFTLGVITRPDGSLGIPLSGGIFELIDFPVGDADRIYAGTGDDLVVAGDGSDLADGGSGNDLMYGESGDDTLLGGAGIDTLHGDGNAGANGEDFIDGGDDADTLHGDENADVLYGGSGNDTLVGDEADVNAGSDYLNGEDGDDILDGAAGADVLYGGDGDDELYGDSISTAYQHQGADYLEGGAGTDLLVGGGGADTLIGGEDADSLYGDATGTPATAVGADYLEGGEGNDLLVGGGGADLLFGGNGADEMHGDESGIEDAMQGSDHLEGGADDDLLFGYGGDDVLLGGEGNDQLAGDAVDTPVTAIGDDYLDGGDGNDTLSGLAGHDLLFGGAGVDSLLGGDGNDDLDGGEGDDTLNGGAGDDTLYGGAGVDFLAGGAGDDRYILDATDLLVVGGLREVISDNQGNNEIVLTGLTSTEVTLAAGQSFGDVTLVLDATHQLALQGALAGNSGLFSFADEERLAAHQLIGRYYSANANQTSTATGAYLLGGTLNDTMSATGEAAVLSGGRGNDVVSGGETKRTTFLFELGDGADTINDRGNVLVGGQQMTNALIFGAGIASESLILDYSQGVLTIRIAGTSDSLRLQRFTATDVLNGSRTLDEFSFDDGTALNWGQLVAQLGIDMVNTSGTTFLTGTNVSDRIQGASVNETLNGQAGDDVISGMAGDDTLSGGTGSDTYVYGLGHGNDIINNVDEGTTTDRLLFDVTMAPADVRWYRYDDTLIARFVDASGRITVNNFFTTGALDVIEFAADGTMFTPATLTLSSPDTQATASADEIYGSQLADVIDALDGDDQVFGGRGDDSLTGSAGSDTLRGEAGNDTLIGGAGTDSLFGGADNDSLYDDAGPGNSLFGEAGNDTLTGIGTLDGGDGNDTMTGGAGTAFLMGGAGDDTLIAGFGSTTLSGGAGNDVYVYDRGNRADTVSQSDSSAVRLDILRFAAGISPSDIVFQTSSGGNLIIRFRMPDGSLDPSDSLTIVRALDSDALTLKLDRIEFASFPGTVWTTAQIEQMVFTPTDDDNYIRATQGDDVVNGLGGFDTINGQGGNDTLNGGDGNDTLLGGEGNDTLRSGSGLDTLRGEAGDDMLMAETGRGTLAGGAGSDTYLVSRAREAITINEVDFGANSVDVLKLDSGISLASTRMRRSGNNLIITVRDLSRPDGLALNTITITGYFATSTIDRIVDEVRFVDEAGIVLRYADVQALTLTSDDTGETLTGFTGNDVILGNGGNDTLSGLDGNDDLDGGAGSDTLNGAAGNDIYRFGTGYGSDTILDSAGTDRIELSAGIAPGEVSLYRTSTVGSDSLVLVLSSGNQQIRINNYFAAGDAQRIEEIRFADGTVWNTTTILANVINLAGAANAQSGTSGNDTFTIDHPSDTVSEAAGAGTDTLNASVTYALPANVENLTLTGPLNINATGNTLANVLRGNAVDNALDGRTGADTLIGEAGDDTYVVDQINTSSWGSNYFNFQDVVTEAAGQGMDTILADTYSAILPDNVERLILRTALEGPNSVLATIDWRRKFIGNASDNYIDVSGVSPSAWRAFLIDGGAGADTMIGKEGENTYVVDNAGDVVIELAASANGSQPVEGDRIESSVTYTASTWVEDLTLLGTDAISGTGNALANILTGNGASNVLTGLDGDDQINGGAGTDTMIGGQGNDRYWVDQAGDSVVETASEGIDTVTATVAHTLADSLEVLLFGAAIGTGTGNAAANLLRAAASNDVLVGGGGTDILEGLAGNDTLSNSGGGNSLLNGEDGADQLSGATGNDLMIGGSGNDSLSGGGGADIIAFNLGDGQDSIDTSAGQDHTISLGGGIIYADLLFEKDADDLVLRVGATDQITFVDYYAGASNRSVSNLQILIQNTSDYDAGSADVTRNRGVQTFDFEGLADAFDAARTANPGLTTWALTNALLAEHLAGSDTAAIGGDLAYEYSRFGSLMQVSFTPALSILSHGSFGSAAQLLQDESSLQDSSPRLS